MSVIWQNPDIIRHSQRLIQSFQHWTGRSLLPESPLEFELGIALENELESELEEIARALFQAPFVVVSHGTEADPIFNYGNQRALELWELDWQTFTQMPSRQSAAPMEQSARAQLLAAAKQQGYISDYRGIRISSSGRQFWIENVILWDVWDEQKQCCGQAATFSQWRDVA